MIAIPAIKSFQLRTGSFPCSQFLFRASSKLAREVAAEGDALTLGGISQCPSYLSGMSKDDVKAEYRKQIKVFVEEEMDFLLCEVILIIFKKYLK